MGGVRGSWCNFTYTHTHTTHHSPHTTHTTPHHSHTPLTPLTHTTPPLTTLTPLTSLTLTPLTLTALCRIPQRGLQGTEEHAASGALHHPAPRDPLHLTPAVPQEERGCQATGVGLHSQPPPPPHFPRSPLARLTSAGLIHVQVLSACSLLSCCVGGVCVVCLAFPFCV